jgi:predicted alpha/beta superfamily hydrolase
VNATKAHSARRKWLNRLLVAVLVLTMTVAVPVGVALWNVASAETPHMLHSRMLAMDRRVTVYMPAGYDSASRRRYPVIYSLDGQSFRHNRLPAIWVRLLSAVGLTHPAIVVAIDNEGTRDIDMRPPAPVPAHNDPPIAGRDAAFTAFLRDELFPYIDQRYRTSSYRIISGHSLGGFYAVDRLSRSPGLFQAHFAYSPTFTHDRASLARLRYAMTLRRPQPALLYMNIGEEGGLNYLAYFGRAATIATSATGNSSIIAKVERQRGMVHPIVMIPGQMRALMWWREAANVCAVSAATATLRRQCQPALRTD